VVKNTLPPISKISFVSGIATSIDQQNATVKFLSNGVFRNENLC